MVNPSHVHLAATGPVPSSARPISGLYASRMILLSCLFVLLIFPSLSSPFSSSSFDLEDHLSFGMCFSIRNLSTDLPLMVGCPLSSTPISFTVDRLFLNFPVRITSPTSRSSSRVSLMRLLSCCLVILTGVLRSLTCWIQGCQECPSPVRHTEFHPRIPPV